MKTVDLSNFISKVGFFVVLTVALAISWWSLYTLALSFGLPVVLAIGVSAAFDGSGLFLAGMTSKSAREGDVSSFAKLGTYVIIALSAFLNVFHARELGLGLMGMVMFGSASLIAGVIFEVYLRYIHRQALKESGRVVARFPVVGKLSFLVHPVLTFRVLDRTIKQRLWTASQQVNDFDDKDPLFARRRPVETTRYKDTPVRAKAVRRPSRGQLEASVKQSPELGPEDPKPQPDRLSALDASQSIAQLVRDLVQEGITDAQAITDVLTQLKGKEVPLATVKKNLTRLRGT